MIELRNYRKGDEEKIEPVEQILFGNPEYKKCWDAIVRSDRTWTGLFNGQILGIGGILPQDNCATIWLIINRKAQKIKMFRTLKKAARLVDSFGFSELKAYVKENFKEGCRILDYFGFQKDSSFKGYWIYKKCLLK